MSDITIPRPAATVVLLRDSKQGIETLLLKRNKALLFAGGIWVFPGGAIETVDAESINDSEECIARRAAIREAHEETGLIIDECSMVKIACWVTPEAEPRRFHTTFFLAEAPRKTKVTIDGSEIHDHTWIEISEALTQHEAGEFGLFPPTIMTLRRLAKYSNTKQAMRKMSQITPHYVTPVFAMKGEFVQVFFHGDVSYESGNTCLQGPKHRSVLTDNTWHYVCENLGMEHCRLDE